jgi:hypothetical protein
VVGEVRPLRRLRPQPGPVAAGTGEALGATSGLYARARPFGDPRPTELDPIVLLWWMRRRVHRQRLPMRRVVIQFDFRVGPTGCYWLVLEQTDVSVCLQHPKFDIDLRVTADIDAFYRVWLGRITLGEAMRERLVRFEGMPAVIRAFPHWFAWSPMVDAVRAASTRRTSVAAAAG